MRTPRLMTLLCALIVAGAAMMAAGPTASQLVADAAAKMKAAKSMVASFNASSGGSTGATRGTLTMSADKFVIDSPKAKVWFDGTTQWSWSAASGEVNITEPTAEEIAEVNPYAVIGSLRSRYKATYIGNPSQRTVLLTPAMPRPAVKRAEITFGANGLPSRMKLTMASGETMTIAVTSVKEGAALAPATFRFAPAKAPGAEIIDLR